ncbi:hypothetical protein KJ849_05975 [bacterium]|nr:hypothetical protein [bacterium]
METMLRVNSIYNYEKENIINNLTNKSDADQVKTKDISNLNSKEEGSSEIEDDKEYDRVSISKKAKLAHKTEVVISQLEDAYLEGKENIAKYRKVIEEGQYLTRKISEVIADKIRDKIMGKDINEMKEFSSSKRDYIAYKIASYLIN